MMSSSRSHRCGVCGTDLSMTKGGMWDFGAGSQLGHEYAGEIIEIGKNRFGLQSRGANQRAALAFLRPMRRLPQPRQQRSVPGKPGTAMVGFAELARLPAKCSRSKMPRHTYRWPMVR
jgi:threonine dehydrogenase-like Zn-dependent dehydrogenase